MWQTAFMKWVKNRYLNSKLKMFKSFQRFSSSLKNSKSMLVPLITHLVSLTFNFCSKKSSKMYGGWLTFTYKSEWKISTFFAEKNIGHFIVTWNAFGVWYHEYSLIVIVIFKILEQFLLKYYYNGVKANRVLEAK